MTKHAFLPAHLPHLVLGFAIALASGCESRLLVGENNLDASGRGGASGAAGTGEGGAAGTLGESRGGAGGTVMVGPGAGGAAGLPVHTGGTGGSLPSTGAAGAGGMATPVGDAGIPLDVWIAFDSDAAGSRDIYIIRADGTERRRLTTETSSETQPSFSRDGTKLAFTSDRSSGLQIYLMDLTTGLETRVTQRAEGAHDAAFTSDGTRIGYRAGASVFTAKLDGTDERQVTDGQTCCVGGPYGAPVFPSSNSQWTIYDDYNAIYLLTSIGATRRPIVSPTTGEQSHPSLSPDGATIVMQATCINDNAARSIWKVPATGTTPLSCTGGVRLSPTMTDATHAAWGPNNMIVWGAVVGGNNSTSPVPSYLVTWQDGILRALTDGNTDDRNPSWSPSGTVIGTW
ncbi:MAG TPA: hypothetical protein VN903_02390 [Polyangia bacterium]|jgi:TolB protein|nr:hypothetical protein [Polyangia bacterium]